MSLADATARHCSGVPARGGELALQCGTWRSDYIFLSFRGGHGGFCTRVFSNEPFIVMHRSDMDTNCGLRTWVFAGTFGHHFASGPRPCQCRFFPYLLFLLPLPPLALFFPFACAAPLLPPAIMTLTLATGNTLTTSGSFQPLTNSISRGQMRSTS